MENLVTGCWRAEGGWQFGAELVLAVAERVEQHALGVAGLGADLDLDIGTETGDTEGWVAQVDF